MKAGQGGAESADHDCAVGIPGEMLGEGSPSASMFAWGKVAVLVEVWKH